MCIDCWESAGSPRIWNSNIEAAVEAALDVYEFNGAGGSLHILLDDWNTEDNALYLCEEYAKEHRGINGDEQFTVEMKCLQAFRSLTEPERVSALAVKKCLFDPFNLGE